MKEHTNAPIEESSARTSTESIRRAGTKNIFISVVVAGASYYSLTLIAKQFGGSVGSDAYFFLASLSTLASGIIGSLMGTVFLPAFIKLLTRSDKSEANRFASSIFSWCLLISSVAALSIVIWNEKLFSIVSRFDVSQISEMHQILAYFAPIFLLSILSELFRVIALSLGRFSTAALTALFPPFFLIAFILGGGNSTTEESLVASLLMAKITALLMLVIVVWREDVCVRFNLENNFHTFQFVKSSAPYWSANVVTNVATFYFDYQASGLGTGVVTALAYANRIFMLPITVFLNPLVEISRTKFAHFQSAGELDAFNTYYNNLLNFTIYFSVPIAAIYLAFSHEIISAMFQRGAFQAENVKIAASCLAIYAWSIPITSIFHVNGRACESFQRLLWPSVFGTLGNLILISVTFTFTNSFGYKGIPMAKVATDIIYLLPFGFFAFQLFGGKPCYSRIFRSVMESTLAAMLASISIDVFFPERYSGITFSLHIIILFITIFFLLNSFFLYALSSHIRLTLKIYLRKNSPTNSQ